MTEDEAKTKWCCGPLQNLRGMMVLSYIANGAAHEVEETFPCRGMCIGSECMAWRWHLKGTDPDLIAARQYPDVPEPNEPDGGYCGMAGKP